MGDPVPAIAEAEATWTKDIFDDIKATLGVPVILDRAYRQSIAGSIGHGGVRNPSTRPVLRNGRRKRCGPTSWSQCRSPFIRARLRLSGSPTKTGQRPVRLWPPTIRATGST